MTRTIKNSQGLLGMMGAAIFWGGGFLLPLLFFFLRVRSDSGGFREILFSPYYQSVLGFTVKQASLSTLFALLLGLPGAYFFARHHFPGRRLLRSLSTLPFVLPPILLVLGFILIFGNSGLINTLRSFFLGSETKPWTILYSWKAILLAHVFYNFPLTLRLVGDAWAALPLLTGRAAASLGASPWRVFFSVELPRLLPAFFMAALITFIYSFLSFSVVLVLGGGPASSTIEVEVYHLLKYKQDFVQGGTLAFLGSFFTLTLLGLYAFFDSRRNFFDSPLALRGFKPRRSFTWRRGFPIFLYLIVTMLFILAPLFAVFFQSFLLRSTRSSPISWTFLHWIRLFGGGNSPAGIGPQVLLNSLILGSSVAFMSVLLASLAARFLARRKDFMGKIGDFLLALPLGVSSIVLGFGYLLVTAHFVLGNLGRLIALFMAHTMLSLPFSYRLIVGRLREISPRIKQAAQIAGASTTRAVIDVELPLIRRSLMTAFVFALALSAGELNISLILAPKGLTTIPLALYHLVGNYDVFAACALGTLLLTFSALAFLSLDRYEEALV